MGSSGSYLKAKADALRIHHRSHEDKQALDLQQQIQAQEDEIATLNTTYRSIKLILYNNSPFSLMLSDFKLSEGVVWLVSPPSKLQPGDCGVFGAFVKDPSHWDEGMPLKGQLVYDGVLPTIHFLTKQDQKKAKKEEAKRRKHSKKNAEQEQAHEAKVQQLKEKQAFRKREKSAKNGDTKHATDDASDDLSHSTTESNLESNLDAGSVHSESLSESNPISPRSQKSDRSAPVLQTSWDAKRRSQTRDKGNRRKSDRPPQTRRAPSNPSLRSQDDSTVSTHSASSVPGSPPVPGLGSLDLDSKHTTDDDSEDPPTTLSSTPRGGSFSAADMASPRSENAPPSSGGRRLRTLPSMLAKMVRPKDDDDDDDDDKLDRSEKSENGGSSAPVTPRGGDHGAPQEDSSPRSGSPHLQGTTSSASIPTAATASPDTAQATSTSAPNTPHGIHAQPASPSAGPNASSPQASSSIRRSKRRSSSYGTRHVHMSNQLEQAIPDASPHRISIDSAGTAKSSNKDLPQLVVQWSVSAQECEFEERCSMIQVAFNELMEHADGHAALLVEVQERSVADSLEDSSHGQLLATPRSMSSLPDVQEEENSGEAVAAAATSSAAAPQDQHHISASTASTASTASFAPTSAANTQEESSSSSPSQTEVKQQSHGLNAANNSQFKPLRKVQRGMSAAYLRSAATLKKADVEELENLSYFDVEEIRELHILFSKVAGYTSHITAESFSAFLPELSDPQLRRAVFAGFDKSRTFDQKISFDEFVLALSSMCRGTLEERSVVVFNMCSSSQASQASATVTREQVLAVVSRIAAAMEQAGFTPRDYGNPLQVVNNVFLKSGEGPDTSRTLLGPRRMRARLAMIAKGIAHHHRDESITNRGQAAADVQERYDGGDDDQEDTSSSADDSQSSSDSESATPDTNVAATAPTASAAPSSSGAASSDRHPPHRKIGILHFHRKEPSKTEKPAKPLKPESSAIPPPFNPDLDLATVSAPNTPSASTKHNHSVRASKDDVESGSILPHSKKDKKASAESEDPLSASGDEDSPAPTSKPKPTETGETKKLAAVADVALATMAAADKQIEPPKLPSSGSASSVSSRREKDDVTESSSSRLKKVAFDASSSSNSDGGSGEGSSDSGEDEPIALPVRKPKASTPTGKASLSPRRPGSPHPSGSPVPSRRAGLQQKVISVARYEEGLTKKQFKTRCRNEPDLPECFGLFDFFNSAVVEPIAKTSAERSMWHRVAVMGVMGKERGSMSRKIGKLKDKRYFVLKDGFLGYSKRSGGPLLRVISIQEASIKPHLSEKKFAFTVIAPYFHRKLFLQNAQEAQLWVHALRSMIKSKNRFKSFAVPRRNIAVRPFMNGKEYFDALVPALLKCKRRLYISGWYLSPGLLLKRGAMGGAIDRFRLDNLIHEAANRGVSVHIIIYNAPSFSDFDLQPSYVCNFFNNLHPNIFAVMHPNNYVPSMWSHHQKLVVCDESVAYIGGIDLCYGRYEDSDYNITDPEETNFPGRDYCNVFLENESNGPSEQALIDRAVQPRMPWSDVQVQLNDMAAFDVGLNFLHRWNHIIREGTYECKHLPFLFPSHSVVDEEQKVGTIDATTGQPFPAMPVEESPAIKEAGPLRSSRLRGSSHGASANNSPANSNPGSARVQDPSSSSAAPAPAPASSSLPTEPATNEMPQAIVADEDNDDVISGSCVEDTIAIPELPWDSRVPIENLVLSHEDLGYHGCNVQIVRSVCGWSAGSSAPEQSIYKAYVSLIREAKHLIFIQNQYFISSIDASSPKNHIAEALYLRLKEAIEHKQDFRVLVLIPVLPGGGAVEAASTRYMLKYTYRTISRGGRSILEKLQQDFPDVDVHEYIKFGTPRQIGRLGDTLLSEPVYIHSKVMIVDDRRAIIGSANINDRSLRGTRDSEVACVIEPGIKESVVMVPFNGESIEACRAVHALRVRMWADMIGAKVHSTKAEDCEMLENLKDAFLGLNHLMLRAELNTKAYLRVFPGMIPNVIHKISDFKRARVDVGPKEDPIVRCQRLEDMAFIRGIITSWPYDFLKDEPMGIGVFEKEYMVPRIVFL